MDKGGIGIMKKLYTVLFIFSLIIIFACKKYVNENTSQSKPENIADTKHKIEFVELGSVNCIPCKKMQPIMKSIEAKYKGLVKVTFHDVWKDEAPAKKYGIELIPTQVFLDENGKELLRHEGFFAEEEIDKFFQSRGVNIPQ